MAASRGISLSRTVRTSWSGCTILWYDKANERRLRGRLREFQLAAEQAGKGRREFDIVPRFGAWVAQQSWFERLAKRPGSLSTVLPQFEEYLAGTIKSKLGACGQNDVFALTGIASLFGLTRAWSLIDKIVATVPGRLLVTFPGTARPDRRIVDARPLDPRPPAQDRRPAGGAPAARRRLVGGVSPGARKAPRSVRDSAPPKTAPPGSGRAATTRPAAPRRR
jgi:hypothetical protein